MRVAAIYDIHGNPSALEAVLHDINENQVDFIVVGGDVVAGPLPGETLTILQNMTTPAHFILGNAESDVLRHLAGKDINGLSERANKEARWVAECISTDHKHFIHSWTATLLLEMNVWGNVLFCHGTPRSDMDIFTKLTPEENLVPAFGNQKESMVICGHTHMQFDRAIGNVLVINAGSVGMPFGRTGADWLLIDSGINLKHTDFDLTMAAERIRNSDYPHAENFVKNNVLQAPSEQKMLEMLKKMEVNYAQR